MASVGVRELRQNATALLRRVAAGEIVTITHRGRPVARLAPIVGGGVDHLVAAGLVRRARRPMSEAPSAVVPPAGRPTAAEALEAARADER